MQHFAKVPCPKGHHRFKSCSFRHIAPKGSVLELLGLPLTTWILVPLMAVPIGIVALHGLRPSIKQVWMIGIAFFGMRLLLEAAYEAGRPDRVFAVAIMWSVYMLAMLVADKLMRRRYNLL